MSLNAFEVKPKTREKILDAAVEVLIESGHAGFSTPRVAEKAGIYQGNLTYYFPNRDSLIEAVSQRIFQMYNIEIEKFCAGLEVGGPQWIENFIDWLMEDAVKPETSRLFVSMWSLAAAHQPVALAVEDLYSGLIAQLITAMGVDASDRASEDLWNVLRMLELQSEGATAVFGRRANPEPDFLAAKALVVKTMAPLVAAALEKAKKGS